MLANIALVINIILLFGMMASFNFVLTLPGIAGIILTIGLAIDANVLVFERLREELAAGKSLRPAIEGAYSKAFSSIFDANVTTLITSTILFMEAAGPVKGFAVSLTLGIVASLFSALIVTRNGFAWATDRFGVKEHPHDAFLREPELRFHVEGAGLHHRFAGHHRAEHRGVRGARGEELRHRLQGRRPDRPDLPAETRHGGGARGVHGPSTSRTPPSRAEEKDGQQL